MQLVIHDELEEACTLIRLNLKVPEIGSLPFNHRRSRDLEE